MSDLPSGWAQTTLGETADTSLGKMLDRGKSQGDHLVPYLRNSNVQWGYIDLDDVLTMDIRPDEREFFRLQPGDLLVCEGGEIGRCAIWAGGSRYMAFQKALHRVRPSEGIPAKFLLYLLEYLSKTGVLSSFATGSTIKHLPQEQLRRLPVSLPPSAEQQRIIATLEDHLSRLDAAVVSTLAAARKAVALRRRTLASLVTPDSSGSWKQYRLKDVSTAVRNGMFISRPGHEPDGVPILRISAVRSLALDLLDLRYTAKSLEVVQREGYLLGGGDLLFTRYNGNPEYVGVCAVVPENIEPHTYPDKLIRVSPDRSLVDPVYLAMACSAGESRQAIRSAVKTTAGQAGISGGEIKRIPLYLPDLDEQRRRAAEFQEHDEAVRHVEENVRSVARRGDHLRRSLLTEAFAGRLVPQDPAEEPAAVLLERIRAEQGTQLRARRRPKTAMHAPQQETLL